MSVTYLPIGGEDEVLASHKLTEDSMGLLIWGDLFESQAKKPFDEWKKSKTPEQLAEMLETGHDMRMVGVMMHGQPISDCFKSHKEYLEDKKNESKTTEPDS